MRTSKGPRPDRPTLSSRLREVVNARGLTAYSLGRDAGVDHRAIQRFLDGEKDLRLTTADKIAEVLGLHLVESGSRRGKKKDESQ